MKQLLYITTLLLLVSCGAKQTVQSSDRDSGLNDYDDKFLRALFIDACTEKILGNYGKALVLFEECLRLDPENAACHFELSNLYAAQGKMMDALEYAQFAADSDPDNIWYQSQLGHLYAATGDDERAAKIFEKLCKKDPENIDFHFIWAENLLYAGDIEGGIEVYDIIEDHWGMNPDLSIQKQMLYEEIGEFDKGIAEIEKLVEWDPQEPRFRGLLAELYAESGRREEALEMYNSIFEIDPNNGMANMALAMYYEQENEDEKYWDHLLKGFAGEDVHIDQKMGVVLDYYDKTAGLPALLPKAYQLIDAMIEAHPNDPKGYSIKGDFYLRDDSLAQGRDMFLKALELDPNKNLIWNEVMFLNSQLNDIDAMLRDSEKAIELYPTMPIYYYFNGIANIQLHEYETAIRSLKTGKSLLLDDLNLLFQFWQSLGDAYNHNGDYEDSDEAYERALDLQPDNVYVLNNYAYYLSLRGANLDKAAEMSLRTNELVPDDPTFEDTYGWILYKQGNFEDAEEWIGKAVQSSGTGDGVILEHYGDVLFQLGRTDEALDYWKQAQESGNASEFIDRKVADKQLYE